MSRNHDSFCRRRFVAGLVAGSFSGLMSGHVPLMAGKGTQSQSSPAEFWTKEYWAKKGDVSLYMFRKRAGAPILRLYEDRRSFYEEIPGYHGCMFDRGRRDSMCDCARSENGAQ
jgi:hypothetical protein